MLGGNNRRTTTRSRAREWATRAWFCIDSGIDLWRWEMSVCMCICWGLLMLVVSSFSPRGRILQKANMIIRYPACIGLQARWLAFIEAFFFLI